MTIRTGVLGAGIVAHNNHFPAVSRNPRTELTAIADVDGEAAAAAGDEYGARSYADSDEMLAEENLDWVHVATPVQTHYDLATTAIDAGAAVLLQKPATTTLEELENLATAAEAADVPISVVHNWLYYPVVRQVRRKVAGGDLGPIRAVETTFTGEGRPDETYRGSWVFDLPGGDFEEGIPHPIYLTLGIGGYPRDEDDVDVQARRAREYDRDVAYDGTTVQYVTDGGCLCSVTYLSGSAPNNEIRIYGEDRSVTVDISARSVEEHDDEEGPFHFVSERLTRNARTARSAIGGAATSLTMEAADRVEDRFDLHRARSVDGHYYLIDEAAKALERGTEPPMPIEQSRQTLQIVEAIRDAAPEE